MAAVHKMKEFQRLRIIPFPNKLIAKWRFLRNLCGFSMRNEA
jgi:hypothetical protein